ncbi:sensor histidine kinase [Brevundimonas sp.]|uniref:sensor histidine kinase n=1 Tax=Brevundimonas sp. TaxID=1871086 RepID=UPI002CAC6C40|nr:ATP-binding protein [Brevundimonas sp.]HWQ86599.1 ATP-binding protein [Brevundimonas sp.]
MEASFARSILVDAPMAVVAVDRTGAIRSSNTTADAFFGRSLTCEPALQIAQFIDDLELPCLTSPEEIAGFNARSRSAGDGVHLRAQGALGGQAFVDVRVAPFSVRDEDFLTMFINDVTPIVTAQTAVQDLQFQITYNWRLNSLGEIASMVAHELNQPLSAVINFLDAAKTLVARDSPDQTKITNYIERAQGQAERAADVIRRLRSLMSHDTGFQAPEVMAEVVAEIMPILVLSARETDAEILIEVSPEDVVRCDRVQIQQLVLNLVRNALDAPVTDRRRRVMISGLSTERGYRILVEDNGPGVAPEMTDRLFVPLASTKVGGMGLGLSICRTIVEAHGGEIRTEASSLGGAGFSCTLMDSEYV